ncbi:PHD finger protein 12 isoform X2 [Adelges cooleyi]|uniref:PHD finger protein 12 isoform X2 n=1 Tax=Adelges cooleyi TaxID=133065 RepID=UPI00218059C3|nr:PHD finger protein 12 isoform X2 [Adelges cooleyi]
MAYKRPVSPRPIELMKDIMKLIAEPISVNKKKYVEDTYFRQPGKEHNHDFCDACREGGDIVCCDRCPRSYHISCHIPPLDKLPDGEWLCRRCSKKNGEPMCEVPINNVDKTENDDTGCPYDYVAKDKFEVDMLPSVVHQIIGKSDSSKCIIFTDIKSVMKRKFDSQTPRFLPKLKSVYKMPLVRKYNGKPTARRQLDKLKLLRKDDKCWLCNRGVLGGRLVQCDFCNHLYHLDCLDPPIRDWDHSMKWLCPEHDKFYVYPKIFKGDRLYSDRITLKRLRCQIPSQTVNTLISIPNHIDAMYKKSDEDDIPTTPSKGASLEILCDIATFELKSMIPDNLIDNADLKVSNDIALQFLALQSLYQLQESHLSLPTKPLAYLSCLTSPNTTTCIQKIAFTIGASPDCDLCLLGYGNCENVSDLHATIIFDENIGAFSVTNHSKYGIIVNNVSYFGNHQPIDLTIRDLNKINFQIKKHINKRRKIVRSQRMFSFSQTNKEKLLIKYTSNKRDPKLDYRSLTKYYRKMLSSTKYTYSDVECSCSKRLIPKDGYPGLAFLSSGSTMLIGCINFTFTHDQYVRSVSIKHMNTDEPFIKREKTIENEIYSKTNEKENSVTSNRSQGDDRIEDEVVVTNSKCFSQNESIVNSNNSNKENQLEVFINGDCSSKNKNIKNTCKTNRKDENKHEVVTNGDCSPENETIVNTPTEQNYIKLDNSVNDSIVNGLSISYKNNTSIEDVNKSNSFDDTESTKWLNTNGVSNKMQSCSASDLIQEVEVDANYECFNETYNNEHNIQEEIVYEMDYLEPSHSRVEYVSEADAQNWIIEEILEEEDNMNISSSSEIVNESNSFDDQLSGSKVSNNSSIEYSVSGCNYKEYKTENVYYHASSPCDETIVISDDDE